MTRTILFVAIVLAFISYKAEANTSAFLLVQNTADTDTISFAPSKKQLIKKKATAIVLALALGPLGMHRIYLNTDYRVPLFYTLTLGAFGVLPLIDIVALLVTKDISEFENNPKMIMWLK